MENLGPLILSNSGLDSLKTILAIRRANDPAFSYSFISKAIGIRSRSYLSEAISGKKPLNAKHIRPIVDLLDLSHDESCLLENKLLLEMGDLNSEDQAHIKTEIEHSAKILALRRFTFHGVENLNTILTLCVTLRLFEGNRASRREILDIFPWERRMEIEKGINDLLQLGLFLKDEGNYRFPDELDDILHLYASTTLSAEVSYLKSSLKEAMDRAQDYKKDSDTSIFYSSIVATDMAEFQAALESIKQNVRGIQSQMVSPGKGDSLIRFNIQLYPIVRRTGGR